MEKMNWILLENPSLLVRRNIWKAYIVNSLSTDITFAPGGRNRFMKYSSLSGTNSVPSGSMRLFIILCLSLIIALNISVASLLFTIYLNTSVCSSAWRGVNFTSAPPWERNKCSSNSAIRQAASFILSTDLRRSSLSFAGRPRIDVIFFTFLRIDSPSFSFAGWCLFKLNRGFIQEGGLGGDNSFLWSELCSTLI